MLLGQTIDYQYKATYKLDFRPDSTNQTYRLTDYWFLLFNEKSAFFTSERMMKMDSAKAAEKKRGNSFGPSMEWYNANGTKNTLVLYKSPSEIVTHDKLAQFETEHYVYKENTPSEWVLSEDTLRIGGTLCNKAMLSYGGRQWEAWYDPSIPVSFGPYKFDGLPGMIYQIEDKTGSWKYALVSLEKIKTSLVFNCSEVKHVSLHKKEYYKNRKNYYSNGGYRLDVPSRKERLDKDNNWIELHP
jgi:GLPGLI family protein